MPATLRSHATDPDAALLRELGAPPPLHEAREALDFWQRRLERLPRRRIAARREARAMTETWTARVREAELAACGSGPLGTLRRLLLTPRPRVGRFVERALLAATVVSVAVSAAFIALIQALAG
jgi:hypothetical protein